VLDSAPDISPHRRLPAEASRLAALIVAVLAAAVGAFIVVLFLSVFEDAFRRGATASGLNPQGGGPGVLLMAPPAIAAFLVASWLDRRGRLTDRVTVVGLVLTGVAVQCIVVLVVGQAVLPADFPSLESPTSAAAMSWAVPVVVMAVLAGL
jgi:hypothetical protein